MKHLLVILLLVLLLAVPTLAQDVEPTEAAPVVDPTLTDEIIDTVKDEGTGFLLSAGGWLLAALVFVSVFSIAAVWNSAPRWAADASKPILQDVILPTLNAILTRLDDAADATKTTLDDEALLTIKRLIDAKVAELGLAKPVDPPAQG